MNTSDFRRCEIRRSDPLSVKSPPNQWFEELGVICGRREAVLTILYECQSDLENENEEKKTSPSKQFK